MKIDIGNLEITVIKTDKKFVGFFKNEQLSGVCVQCDKIEDIPIDLSIAFSKLINHAFHQGKYKVIEFDNK